MKKMLVLFAIASLTFTSCDNDDLETVNVEYEKIKAEKKEEKKDPNFRIFNDHYQIGAEWRD